ncbi:MAG TPA: hypothetical protein DDZ89_07960 [Clostridiales bacterium]|nr:hypothetical protein [Clostridiales bacterium]
MLYKNYFEQLRKAIPLLMEAQNVPALSISVTNKSEVVFSEGFGFTDPSHNFEVNSNTRFSLQSISKTYTAFGFMLTVDKGKVSLDETLKKYIPSFNVRSRDNIDYSNKITFRHLLKHRSGLAHEAPVGNNFSFGTFEEHIKSINDTCLKFKPDEDYSYSNLGIDLIAHALEKIYDMPFEEFMEQYVFAPLDMKLSTYKQEIFLCDIKSAVGHGKKTLVKNPIPMLGAGGMYSCTEDMVKFIDCFLNDGVYKGKKVINENTLKLMYEEYPASENWQYNLGLDVGLFKGKTILNHNGGGYGFYCSQDILPDMGLGAASLTNSVMHPNIQHSIIRNMWSDFITLADEGLCDCDDISDKYKKYIGVYQANYIDDNFKEAIIPRNGELYLGNQKLQYHSTDLFFTQNNDIVEFASDNCVRINYIEYQKVM